MANKFAARLKSLRSALTGAAIRAKAWRLMIRMYALLILCVLVLCGYLAVAYLVKLVFYAAPLPVSVEQWQGNLDVAALRSDTAPGVETPAPRAPLSHYHQINQWMQQDKTNGCTISGCHEPLPHDMRAKVPAFANFHTTFLACQMCHVPTDNRPAAAQWISIDTAKPQDTPSILRLMKMLEIETDLISSRPAEAQPRLRRLLGQTISDVGGDPLLDEILAQIETSEPGSPVWKQAVTLLTSELPQHARGEYRAKLVWSELAGNAPERLAILNEEAGDFAVAVDPQQKATIQKQIHA